MALWNKNTEIKFFEESLKNFASPEQVFYHLKDGFYAYVPNSLAGDGKTLQSRNSLIGQYTEKWCKTLFQPIAERFGLYSVNNVICEELGLTNRSSADLAFCTSNLNVQQAKNIKLLFEIKMSIVSNYKLLPNSEVLQIGDYKTHKGNPGLLRSDSMLKAIGKSINIRVSGSASAKIPIVILGNTPISDSYIKKVDFLKSTGVIQGFWSLNPEPTVSKHTIETPGRGFVTFKNTDELLINCNNLLKNELYFFSSMMSPKKLGKLISIANEEMTDLAKGEKFLSLLKK